ncbi:MAG: prolyl oligopeptidase family serine peptidase [Terriglobia bacterium]
MQRAGTLSSSPCFTPGHCFALRKVYGTLLLLFFTFCQLLFSKENDYPPSKVEPVKENLHGVGIVDSYRWLEDQNSPETRAWIEAQNKYTSALIEKLPGRDAIKHRLSELLRTDSIGVPVERNGFYFFSKRKADLDLSIVYVRKGLNGPDEVLLDPHPLSADHTTSIDLLDVSGDGSLAAYGIRRGGADEIEIHLIRVATRQELQDVLPRARYSGVSLHPDNHELYYSRFGTEGPRVNVHSLGKSNETDVELFGKGFGPETIIGLSLSEDGRYLLATVYHGSAGQKTEIYACDLRAGNEWATIVNDLEARFLPDVALDVVYLNTNWKAPNGRIFKVDLKNPAREKWQEVVPESDSTISGFSASSGRLFVNFLKDVRSTVKMFSEEGRFLREIPFPALGSVGAISGRWQSPESFISYSSFLIPGTIYRYDVNTGDQTIWAETKIPFDANQFEARQVWYLSKDQTPIPMFLVHSKGLKKDGRNPAFLTGYGGFLQSQTPSFSALAVYWVEQGGVFAVANLRGGGEFGETWHRAGMQERKQNVFDDFISASEWLIHEKYTSPSKLAIAGGSNGGLLVGAALTQRPELFGAVVCSYPLLDMIRYHQFLVARFWIPEYGSAEDPKQFKVLFAYSPYQHVQTGTKYPAVLFITGDRDTRVAPLHARKMTALLQASSGSDRPVLLRYDTKAGHSRGATPVGKKIDELADELSFLFWQLGVTIR